MRMMIEQTTGIGIPSASSAPPGGGTPRKAVRRIVKSPQASPNGHDEGVSLLDSVSGPLAGEVSISGGSFKCFQCGAMIPVGSESCPKCGTKYVMDEVSDIDDFGDELGIETLGDALPLIDERSISCGYFDVARGIFAYSGAGVRQDDCLFECSHCKTLLEFEARRCPLCGGEIEKTKEGIAEIASGSLLGGTLDLETSDEVFCPLCGDLLALDMGRCILCDAQLVVKEEGPGDYVQPVVSSEKIVFVHLDVEAGEIEYVTKDGVSAQEDALGQTVAGTDDDPIDWSDESKM